MERFEYMRIPVHQIPKEIYDQYNLQEITHNGFVYVEIRKGIVDYPKQEYLPTHNSSSYWQPTDTIKPHTPMDYSTTPPDPSHLH